MVLTHCLPMRNHGATRELAWAYFLYYLTLSNSLKPCELQFSHQSNGHWIVRWKLSEIIYVKHLTWDLAHSRCSINGSYYYCLTFFSAFIFYFAVLGALTSLEQEVLTWVYKYGYFRGPMKPQKMFSKPLLNSLTILL